MRHRSGLGALLLASSAAGALFASSLPASAGGFAVREQSTEFQGMSFAGNGTSGGGLSGMFWNPAVAAYAPTGIYSEAHYAAIVGNVEMRGDTTVGGVSLGMPQNSGDTAKDAIVPSSYMSYRLNEKLVFAMSVNSPFGLVTEPANRAWAGQTFARTSEIKTYNFTPTLAYRITPTLAVGVGVQIEHIEGRLKSASGVTPASLNLLVKGDDTAFGFTAGVNWTPNAGTHIGLGYRSSIDHTLEGTVSIPGSPVPPAALGSGIKAGTTLPEIVTLSIRQALTPTWTLLGTVEWTHWERAQKLDITCANTLANPVFCPGGNGQLVRSLALGWHDSWFMSAGLENRFSDKLTLRGGVAYEISPVQNPDERSLRVPDMDRLWLSVGATYKMTEKIAMDFAYTHIFGVGDDQIDRTESGLRFVGTVDSQVDIISGSLKIKLGDVPHQHEPMK